MVRPDIYAEKPTHWLTYAETSSVDRLWKSSLNPLLTRFCKVLWGKVTSCLCLLQHIVWKSFRAAYSFFLFDEHRYRRIHQYTDTYSKMKRDRRVKETSTDTATKFWVAVVELQPEYREISQLALTLLLIPHSSAIAERIFLMINHSLIHVNAWLRTKYLIINNNHQTGCRFGWWLPAIWGAQV